MEGLATAARNLGLKAEGIQVGRDALERTHLPCIAWDRGRHFIAVLALSGGPGDSGMARTHDPNLDHESLITQEELLRRSGGYLLKISR